jgi:hypothetical protein
MSQESTMPFFDDMFMGSKGKPIIYNGITLIMGDLLPVQNGEKLKLVIESIGSDWLQGIGLRTNLNLKTKGWLDFIDKEENIKTPVAVWFHKVVDPIEFIVHTKDNQLMIYNVWDNGDGTTNFWTAGGAMIVEEIPKGRRYRCNDGYPDEDFDDLIFRIERLD